MRRALWAVAAAAVFVAACGKEEEKDEQELTTPPQEQPQRAPPMLSINEVVPGTAGCLDDTGQPVDAIELYNRSGRAIRLEGFALTDDEADLAKAPLDSSLVVPSRGALVFWADGQPELGPQHLPFKLGSPGGLLLLTGSAQSVGDLKAAGDLKIGLDRQFVLDRVDLAEADGVRSFARFPDGEGDFANCKVESCGESNGPGCGFSLDVAPEPTGQTRRR